MRTSREKFYKPILLGLAVGLLILVSLLQSSLNVSREKLGITRLDPLNNMPPILAFTTQALGGFRGLIANALWIRATDLQEQDRYFEMMQLADWITKLEPHYVGVWNVQSWNMVYNISIKFKDPADRWRFVKGGIELLRDEGLKFNPGEVMMYRELGWYFQHKMGQNMDDAHMYFKLTWAKEMNELFGSGRPNFEALMNPKTEDEKQRALRLRDKYKMDPKVMKDIDVKYGPLEWRMPETHSIYWAWLGLQKAKGENLIALRRMIYQSMQLAFFRGAIIEDLLQGQLVFGPNLDMVENANQSYEDMLAIDKENEEHIKTGHRNFLRNVPYFLYLYNRQTEATKWMKILQTRYPEIVGPNVTLDEYAVSKTMEEVGDTSVDKTSVVVGGLIIKYFASLIQDEDEAAMNYYRLAKKVWERFQDKIKGQEARIGLKSFEQTRKDILDSMLDPERGIHVELQARLRTKLGMPAAPPSTNSLPPNAQAPAPVGTNAASAKPVVK